jgi:hypothetical protein
MLEIMNRLVINEHQESNRNLRWPVLGLAAGIALSVVGCGDPLPPRLRNQAVVMETPTSTSSTTAPASPDKMRQCKSNPSNYWTSVDSQVIRSQVAEVLHINPAVEQMVGSVICGAVVPQDVVQAGNFRVLVTDRRTECVVGNFRPDAVNVVQGAASMQVFAVCPA